MNSICPRGRVAYASPLTSLIIGMFLVGACGDGASTGSTQRDPLVIDEVAASSSQQGADFELAMEARGGRGNLTWSVVSGQLPEGLALVGISQRTVRVSGRPTKVGTFTFDVSVVDSEGQRATRTVGLMVLSSLAIEGDRLPDATEDQPYREQLTAVRGSGGYRWRISAGALPEGVALSGDSTATVTLEGAPKPGRFAFTLTVADADGNERSREIDLWVRSAIVIVGDPQPALVGDPFELTLRVRGGIGPYDWRVLGGNIPGLELTADGAAARLHGTPWAPGRASLQIEVADRNSGRGSRLLGVDLRDRLHITTETLPTGKHGVAYSTQITGAGGLDEPYHWEVIAGALPGGLTLSTEGAPAAVLVGTPTANGTFAFTVRLSTASGHFDQALRLDVRNNPPQLAGATLTAGTWGQDYAEAITGVSQVGGAVQWRLIGGWLPPGVELEASTSTTVIARGRPALSGAFEVTLQMTDAGGVAQATFRVEVAAVNPFQLVARTLPRGRVGDAYAATLQTRNAVGDVSWRIASGELPPGVELQGDGPRAQLVGAPTTAGFYRFTVEATAGGLASSGPLAIQVRPVTSWALVSHSLRFGGPYSVSVADVTSLPAATPVVVKDALSGWVSELTVSPDGRYATFVSGDLSRKSLYLVDLRGGPHPAALLTTSLRGDRGGVVEWSPDGAFGLVPVQVADFEFNIHMLDLSGASPSFRSLGIARADLDRAWAPDGRSAAFASPSGDIVYIATRSGASWSTRAIPTGSTALWPMRWLSDGSGLLYAANGTNQGLFFIDGAAASPLPMRLTRPRFFFNPNLISVTEDGTRLLLTNCCGGIGEDRGILVFDSSRPAFAQPFDVTGGMGGPIGASWSPDSRHVFIGDERNDAKYIVDADAPPTAPPTALPVTGLDGPMRTVAWTPDGLSLLATTDTAVYRIPAFATPEADRLLGGFWRWPRTWFLGAQSPFVFIDEGSLQVIDLGAPADQRPAMRVDTIGSGNHYHRADPLRERVYYSDLAVDHHSLYIVDVSGPAPGTPVELLRVPNLGSEGFSD